MSKKLNTPQKFLSYTFKILGTLLLWIGTAILTKLKLAPNADTWKKTFQDMPLSSLTLLFLFFPFAWLFIEFISTCFIEVRAILLQETAPRFAQFITKLPNAISSVLARKWDVFIGVTGRWRFDGRYKTRIAEECQQLHTQTGLLHATAGFSLEHAYTELNMASTQYGEISQSLLASDIKGRESIYSFLRIQESGSALAILGRPGGGKTTLVRHLGLLYATNAQGKFRLRRRIPIIIELRRVTELFVDKPGLEWTSPNLTQVIQFYWKNHSSLKDLLSKAPSSWLKRHFEEGRVIVMIDGLDEVPHRIDSGTDKSTPRQRVSDWLQKEMQREGQRKCLFIVTSRPGGFSEAPLKERVTVLEVQPLNTDQSGKFIHSFHYGCLKKLNPSWRKYQLILNATKLTMKLQEELSAKPHLSDLRVNPLLLHMVCLVHHLRGRLPDHRSDLYKETCEVLLDRDLRSPGISEYLRPNDKLSILKILAEHFMRSGSPEAKSTEDLLNTIHPIFETLHFQSNNFLDFLAKDNGILQEVEHGFWDFAHKTFYEYLTAEYWEKNPPSVDELNQWVAEDWWRVTLLFYSSKSSNSPVITSALNNGSAQALSLAFECLDAGHRINQHDRQRAVTSLNLALKDPDNKRLFIPAAKALLYLRCREIYPTEMSDSFFKRKSLITQAEFQLFLYSVPLEHRWRFFPSHWQSDCFNNDPLSPILGITLSQALAFSKWVRKVTEEQWYLPPCEIGLLEFSNSYWTFSDSSDSTKKDITQCQGMIAGAPPSVIEGIEKWAYRHQVPHYPTDVWLNALSVRSYTDRERNDADSNESIFSFFNKRSSILFKLDPANLLFPKSETSAHFTIILGRIILGEISRFCFIFFADDYSMTSHNSLPQREHEILSSSTFSKDLLGAIGMQFLKSLNFDLIESKETRKLMAKVYTDGFKTIANFQNFILKNIPKVTDQKSYNSCEDNIDKLRYFARQIQKTTTMYPHYRRAWLDYIVHLTYLSFDSRVMAASQTLRKAYHMVRLFDARSRKEIEPWEGLSLIRYK